MSSINEAYARIDYEAIVNIQQSIRELKKDFARLVGRKAVARVNGSNLSIAKLRIFAERVEVPKDQSEIKVEFGPNRFQGTPIVTATAKPSSKKLSPLDIGVTIQSYNKTSVTFLVEREKSYKVILNVIAIGEAADTSD